MADGVTSDVQTGESWQTIEQAAVALGLSVRTVNRHIQAGKLRSRLTDGRREVLVILPTLTDNEFSNGPDSKTEEHSQPEAHQNPDPEPASSEPIPPTDNGAEAPRQVHGDAQGQTFQPKIPFDVESQLARADNAADKAELAVSAYQNLARSIENQAHSARKSARVAWSILAALSLGVMVAVGWTASRLTRAQVETENLRREAEAASKTADRQAGELDHLRDRLSVAEQDAARAQEKAANLSEQQPRKPATHPSLVDRLTSAFNGQTSSDH